MSSDSVYPEIPCVATASHVLYCVGSKIYVQRHDADHYSREFDAQSKVRGIRINEFDDKLDAPTQRALSWGINDEIAELWHIEDGRIGVCAAGGIISTACFISGGRIALCLSDNIHAAQCLTNDPRYGRRPSQYMPIRHQ